MALTSPIVTVLMPVYNGQLFLREAIDSILNQTFKDFQFLIINDGSSDQSVAIIESYTDNRIRLVHNERNIGLVATLNRGISLSHSAYIARMDCDDVSLPERLEKQVSFLEENRDVALCATGVVAFSGSQERMVKYPISGDEIKSYLFFYNCIAHPSVMLRRSLLNGKNSCYDPNMKQAEDYDLWVRLSSNYRIENIGITLLKYREHQVQRTALYTEEVNQFAEEIRNRQLGRIGIIPSMQDKEIHKWLSKGIDILYQYNKIYVCDDFTYFNHNLKLILIWIDKLLERNRITNFPPTNVFSEILERYKQGLYYLKNCIMNLSDKVTTRKLYIWGTGKRGQAISLMLASFGFETHAFVDSSPSKWNKTFLDKPIISPDFLGEVLADSFVVIGSMYYEEISTSLTRIGAINDRDYITGFPGLLT